MRRFAWLLTAVLGTVASAQVLNFRDLGPETQDELLAQYKPAMRATCAEISDRRFTREFDARRADDACLAKLADDDAFVTYVREESDVACLRAVTKRIRASEGQMIQLKITDAEYGRGVAEVIDRLRGAGCGG